MKPENIVPAPRPRGAVFVSYRQNDGRPVAARMAWTLRAMGMPVWHDDSDLPPGDTVDVIREALAGGLSGAILIITDDIKNSPVVKAVEWPMIRDLNSEGEFTLGVLNCAKEYSGDIYSAPDHYLRRRRDRVLRRYRQHIKGLKQYRFAGDKDEMDRLAADMLRQRLHHLRDAIRDRGYAEINLATRADPNAEYAEAADLTFRWDRNEARLPSLKSREQLRRSLHVATSAIRDHVPASLRFHGQAHLSFGLAIGASLTLGPEVQFLADDGLWRVTKAGPAKNRQLTETDVHPRTGKGPVLMYADLIGPPSDAAYNALAESRRWSECLHVRGRNPGERVASADGDRLAHELADIMRAASGRNANCDVHLLLRTPLPVAILLGTLLNTLTVTTYEWSLDGDSSNATYVPIFRLRPGSRNTIVETY